jgi:hypothetical protein
MIATSAPSPNNGDNDLSKLLIRLVASILIDVVATIASNARRKS